MLVPILLKLGKEKGVKIVAVWVNEELAEFVGNWLDPDDVIPLVMDKASTVVDGVRDRGIGTLLTGLHARPQHHAAALIHGLCPTVEIVGCFEQMILTTEHLEHHVKSRFYGTLDLCDYAVMPDRLVDLYKTQVQERRDIRAKPIGVGGRPELANEYKEGIRLSGKHSDEVALIEQDTASFEITARALVEAAKLNGFHATLLRRPPRKPPPAVSEGFARIIEWVEPANVKNDALSRASVVVTEYSTLGYVCALAGKRVLYVRPNRTDPLQPYPLLYEDWDHVRCTDVDHIRDWLAATRRAEWHELPEPIKSETKIGKLMRILG